MLDGQPVSNIHADLTAGGNGGSDLTAALPLKENAGWSYFGLCLAGAFKVPSATAQAWLKLPNPHGKPNSDVLKPIYNGSDITRRWAGDWVIDFALLDELQAALYEAPFAYVVEHVKPTRIGNNRKARAEKWWRHGEARPGLRNKLAGLQRYIATPETAKHRFFVSLPAVSRRNTGSLFSHRIAIHYSASCPRACILYGFLRKGVHLKTDQFITLPCASTLSRSPKESRRRIQERGRLVRMRAGRPRSQ